MPILVSSLPIIGLSAAFTPLIVVVSLTVMGLITHKAWARRQRFLVLPLWGVFGILLVGSVLWIEQNASTMKVQRQTELAVYAKAIAAALEVLGHETLTIKTPRSDPTMDAIMREMRRWLYALQDVAAIYTLRRDPNDDKLVFIACPVCDLNRDQIYGDPDHNEGEVGAGVVFELEPEAQTQLLRGFEGESLFSHDPIVDEWGVWYTATEPVRNKHGEVEALLMIDFWKEHFDLELAKARLGPQLLTSLVFGLFFVTTSLVQRRWCVAEEMRQYTDTLEEHMRESAKAKRAADRAAQDRGFFLAKMSHKVRTPITSILGYAEIMGSVSSTPEEQNRAAQTILSNTEKLLALLNDILDFSKIEAGKITPLPTPVSVSRFFEELLLQYVPVCHRSHIECVFYCTSPIPMEIVTDPIPLRHIMTNLLDNALKFTPSGGVSVALSWRDTPPLAPLRVDWLASSESRVGLFCIDVHDSGIGMNEATLAALFRPFEQAEWTMTSRFGGTGLGLSIVQGLVKLLGGETHVRSELGRGSTFSITLPQVIPLTTPWGDEFASGVAVAASDASITPTPTPTSTSLSTHARSGARTIASSQSRSVARGAKQPLAGRRILLADDSPDSRRLFEMMLTKAGAQVLTATNGLEALEKANESWCAQRPFDIVLLDMQMPVMDGYTATQNLRQIGYLGKIVALTAYTLPTEIQQCLTAGCDDYATKPIHRDALIEAVLKHL